MAWLAPGGAAAGLPGFSREAHLHADILRLTREWQAGAEVPAAVAEKDPQVRRQLDRLREVARQQGIDPDGGTARTA